MSFVAIVAMAVVGMIALSVVIALASKIAQRRELRQLQLEARHGRAL